MILTCPECATSYFVDDARIPAAGRTVKCSNCAARWVVTRDDAEPEPNLEPASPPEPEPAFSPDPAFDVEDAALPPVVQSLDDLKAKDDPPLRTAPRRRPPPPKKEPVGKAVGLGLAIVTVAALVAAGVGLRAKIVERWPAATGVYAALGLSVNDLGLVIEDVEAKPAFQGGRPVLSVTGSIRNLRKNAAQAPPLEVSLLDKAGKPLSVKIANPIEKTIPPLARRHFALSLIDPPADLHDLKVRFQEADAGVKAPAHAPEPHAAPAEAPHAAPDAHAAPEPHHG